MANSPPKKIVKICKPKNHFASFYIVLNGRGVTRFIFFWVSFLSKNLLFEVINSIAIAGEWRGAKNEKLHGKK